MSVLLCMLGGLLFWVTDGLQGCSLSLIQRSSSRLFQSPLYLERMVERKKIEVDSLLRRHQAIDDPLVMRMSYIASECRYVHSYFQRFPHNLMLFNL